MPSKKLKKAGLTKKFDRCVSKVKRKGKGNAFAICEASLQAFARKNRNNKKMRLDGR